MKTYHDERIEREYHRIQNKPKLSAKDCIVAPPGSCHPDYEFQRAESINDVGYYMRAKGARIVEYRYKPILDIPRHMLDMFGIIFEFNEQTHKLEFGPSDIIFYIDNEFCTLRQDNIHEYFEVVNE